MWKSRCSWLRHLALVLLSVLLVEAQRQGGRKKSAFARRYGKNPEGLNTGLRFLGILLLVIFAPAILYFCYNVSKDPATPEILSTLWQKFKTRSVGYLGSRASKSRRRTSLSSASSGRGDDDDDSVTGRDGLDTARTEEDTIYDEEDDDIEKED